MGVYFNLGLSMGPTWEEGGLCGLIRWDHSLGLHEGETIHEATCVESMAPEVDTVGRFWFLHEVGTACVVGPSLWPYIHRFRQTYKPLF